MCGLKAINRSPTAVHPADFFLIDQINSAAPNSTGAEY
jgi:hypothetical protein